MFRFSIDSDQQRGIILVIVLWFITIITIIVAVLANEVRLSSKIVFANKMGMNTWSDTLTTLNMAKMELFVNQMPDPPKRQGENEVPLAERRNKAYRFNGQVLNLAYPSPKTVTVRIYDHAGKIALHQLTVQQMRKILEHQIGSNDPDKLNALLDTWQDWVDRDDLKRAKGAEKDFYKKQIVPYEPRNALFEFVDELLLVKGFEKVFKDVNLEAALTIYSGQSARINPNLATKEALMLLPGFDESTVNAILSLRREKDLKSFQELNEIMPPEQLTQVQEWIEFGMTSNVFTIAIIPKEAVEKEQEENSNPKTLPTEEQDAPKQDSAKQEGSEFSLPQKQFAYMTTIQFRNFRNLPDVKMVNPYGWVPDMSHETLPPPPKKQLIKSSQ